MSRRKRPPQCACGRYKVDGRCLSGCDEFRKPGLTRISSARVLRERERKANAPGSLLNLTEASEGEAKARGRR